MRLVVVQRTWKETIFESDIENGKDRTLLWKVRVQDVVKDH